MRLKDAKKRTGSNQKRPEKFSRYGEARRAIRYRARFKTSLIASNTSAGCCA
jgi:hypothetical protein